MEENFTEKQVELSKEELDQRRKEITEFYKTSIVHLKVQKEYEQLLCEIEKLRAERVQAQMFLAQAYAPDPEKENAEEDFDRVNEETKRRTLKREQ